MTNTKNKDYEQRYQKRTKRNQKIMTVVSVIGFFGSAIFGAAQLLGSAFQEPNKNAPAIASDLQAQERGYELVLQREPENQSALEGLVRIRMQMKNAKAAKEPIEKLIKLHPERQDYQHSLAQIKQQVGDR